MVKKLVCDFKLAANVIGVESGFVYDAYRPAVLKGNLVRLDVDGNR